MYIEIFAFPKFSTNVSHFLVLQWLFDLLMFEPAGNITIHLLKSLFSMAGLLEFCKL